nr:MAG: capsid protein [Cressdnaviricota sp.]
MARKTFRRKKRTFTKKITLKKVEKQIKTIQKELNPRINYIDTATALTAVTYTGTVVPLCTGSSVIAQGVEQGERTGDAVFLKSLFINGIVYGNPLSTLTTSFLRLVIVRAKREDQVVPTISDLFYPNTGSFVNIYAPYYWEEHKKYVILYDKVFSMCANYTATLVPATALQPGFKTGVHFQKHIKINHKLQYALDGNQAEDGGVYMFIIGDQVTNGPIFDCYSRVMYE